MKTSVDELYDVLIRSQLDSGKSKEESEKYANTFLKNFLIRISYQNKDVESQIVSRTKLLNKTLRPLDEVLLAKKATEQNTKKA